MEFESLRQTRKIPALTPLIDIVFLLLVFVMLAARFVSEQSLDIVLPDSKSAAPMKRDKVVEIVVGSQGQILLGNNPVPIERLEDSLRQALAKHTHKKIILRGDRTIKLGLVVKIMDAARAAGVKSLDIVTKNHD